MDSIRARRLKHTLGFAPTNAPTTNPYFIEFLQAQNNPDSMISFMAREALVSRYAWAVPDMAVLENLVSRHKAIVEIGAGTGYWAWLLKVCRAQVMAFDIHPPKEGKNPYKHETEWTTVYNGGPSVLHRFDPTWSLFMCWPPYQDSMGADCLKAYKGKHVIYVGENGGGCTGDEEMHQILADDYTVYRETAIPQWTGIHDVLIEYVRK